MTTVAIDKGTGTVRLATASGMAKADASAKKEAHQKALEALSKAKQAYAEAEVKHYSHMHKDTVDPDELSASREHVDACHASFIDAKKAAVKAEAEMYDDGDKQAMATAAAEAEDKAAEDKAAMEKEAKEKEEAEAKAKADAEDKAAFDNGEGSAKAEAEAKAKAEAEAKAAAEATAKAEAEAKAKAESESTATASAKAEIEALKAKLAEAESKLATASTKPEPKAQAANGAGSRDAIARATVSFDQKAAADGKNGKKVVVLGGKAPNGGNLATASAVKATDLTGLFRR